MLPAALILLLVSSHYRIYSTNLPYETNAADENFRNFKALKGICLTKLAPQAIFLLLFEGTTKGILASTNGPPAA